MSQEQLVAAYLDGRLSRRTLIRRLVVAASRSAARSRTRIRCGRRPRWADAGRRALRRLVEVLDSDLDRAIAKGGLKVRATVDRPMDLYVEVRLLRNAERTAYPNAIVGSRTLSFASAGSKAMRIPFDANPPHSLRAVRRQRKRAKFRVSATGSGNGNPSTYTTIKTISR